MVEVPSVMVDSEITQMFSEFENNLRTQGMTMDMYYQFSGLSEDQLRGQMKPDAEKRVRNNLVLEAIASAESIEASEEDLTEELEKIAQQYQRPVDEIRSILAANNSLDAIKNDLSIRKTVHFLVESSQSVEAQA